MWILDDSMVERGSLHDPMELEFQAERLQLSSLEHVLFLIDVHPELDTIFDSSNNKSRLQVICDLIQRILKRKTNNSLLKHQFALAIYSDAEHFFVLRPFKTNTEEVLELLKVLRVVEESTEELDIHLLFDRVYQSFSGLIDNPSTILRCIFVCGRSFEVGFHKTSSILSQSI